MHFRLRHRLREELVILTALAAIACLVPAGIRCGVKCRGSGSELEASPSLRNHNRNRNDCPRPALLLRSRPQANHGHLHPHPQHSKQRRRRFLAAGALDASCVHSHDHGHDRVGVGHDRVGVLPPSPSSLYRPRSRKSLWSQLRSPYPITTTPRITPRATPGDVISGLTSLFAPPPPPSAGGAKELANGTEVKRASRRKRTGGNVGCYDDGDGVLQMVFLDDDNIPLVQGMWDPKNPLDFRLEYSHQQVAVATAIQPRPEKILVLGLGVGAIPRTLRALFPGMVADVVEIDSEVIEATRGFFQLRDDEQMLRVHNDDATAFVKREECKGEYSIVYMDAYNAQGIPDTLLTEEFYNDMISCLRPGGVLSINLIDDVEGAETVLDYAEDLLVEPMIIRAPSTSNQAIFGVPKSKVTASGEPGSDEEGVPYHTLVLRGMQARAGAIDSRLTLPFSVAPYVNSIELLEDVRARNFSWDLK